ncbi:UbiA family prenyltransferase [Ahrensia sp. 13_GOM-1096m]|uniref:UbiA family prenyltransferase n=1 Tax=Ahrensia sp. 13_GOM-1096m TaxID=1380380 RepID=UPI00047E88AC|nr:UbiA family prenyltransferase [Ahrensia sp. 13_GOM-1096m]
MDAKTENQTIPLAVDLDGTLIAADLLWECLFKLIRRNALFLFMVPYWVAVGGKIRLKQEVFSRVDVDPTKLPYREEVLDYIRAEKSKGRKIILATASAQHIAEKIAAELGLFDVVIGSTSKVNLKSKDKTAYLVKEYGDGGFDYMGNSRDDLAVFDASHKSIVVAPDKHARQWAKSHSAETLADGGPATFKEYLKMLRVHQWAKNVLIAVAPILDHRIFDFTMIMYVVGAFFAFSFLASSVYVFNDLFDLAIDRTHPTKRKRPLASGRIDPATGIKIALCLIGLSVLITMLLPSMFAVVLVVYFIATTAYSLKVKRWLLLDVLTLAGLYTIRVVAGAAVTFTPASFWLLAFSVFFFLSLALVKRFVELDQASIDEKERLSGRGYRPEDKSIIAQSGIASAFASILVLALYIQSDAVFELYEYPFLIWPICPLVLYIIMRVWILANRREFYDDPVVFIISDWRSQIMIALGAVLMLVAGLLEAGGTLFG